MTEKSLKFVKRDDLSPVCPHCTKQLTEVYTRSKGVPSEAEVSIREEPG